MKIVILRDIPYSRDEEAWLSINGAVFLEEFRRRGHEAFKLLLDDTGLAKPVSSLLRVSSSSDRIEPAFWRRMSPDAILYYGSLSSFCLRTLEAIRIGAPNAFSVFRVEGCLFPERLTPRSLFRSLARNYVDFRHCPSEGWNFEKRSVLPAFGLAFAKTGKSVFSDPGPFLVEAAGRSDALTFFFPRMAEAWKDWFRAKGHPDLAGKCMWSGTPVRPEFRPRTDGKKSSGSVISIAKWRHFKSPELTAAAMALVLKERPEATFTVVGARSDRVSGPLLAAAPEAASRVRTLDYLANQSLPGLLADKEVFLSCSWREGIPGALSEALCCGCSVALSSGPGVESFRDFVSDGCGTQSRSRRPRDMADAIEHELDSWKSGARTASTISGTWNATHVGPQCDRFFEWFAASAVQRERCGITSTRRRTDASDAVSPAAEETYSLRTER